MFPYFGDQLGGMMYLGEHGFIPVPASGSVDPTQRTIIQTKVNRTVLAVAYISQKAALLIEKLGSYRSSAKPEGKW